VPLTFFSIIIPASFFLATLSLLFEKLFFSVLNYCLTKMTSQEFSNPLRKFKLVFLGEQSGKKEDEKFCDELNYLR
jgi:hypothetical protein